jgi:hypothetical protein
VQLGSVPEWIQGPAEAGALYLAVRGRRQQQAIDWAKILKELSGLSDEELRHVVEDNPVVAEIVGRAREAGADTASQDKRRLLERSRPPPSAATPPPKSMNSSSSCGR